MTKFAVNTDLLDNAKNVKRLICPSENAFDAKNEIEKEILSFCNKEENPLILLSLGPTATVLSLDIAKHGYQAIDVGHIDMEYIWFNLGVEKPVDIPWKYMNELKGGNSERERICDKQYESEILKFVGLKEKLSE